MVLGISQGRGVLLLQHMVGQGPAVLAAGAGRVNCFCVVVVFFFCFVLFLCVCVLSRLSYIPFLKPHLLGDGWTY